MTLVGQDGSLIIVPNGQVAIITNLTHSKVSNRLEITIKFLSDVDHILNIFEHALKSLEHKKIINFTQNHGLSVSKPSRWQVLPSVFY